jgi:hypothetical protein
MKRSEIFESFVKIAQEKGLVSNDSSEAKKKLEQTGRAGSDDISTIEALYGVKPDTAKGMDYKNNIMEAAHPNSIVVSPSYDKLHGLVENEIERQNINLHIVNKPVNGLSTQHKYAEKELILSLVRIGNDLDNRGNEDLRTLADTCLMQVAPIKKEAWIIPVAVGAAIILGGVYLKNHMRFISDGLEKDHAKLIAEIDDILNSNADWGVGYQYKQEFTTLMQNFKTKLDAFYKTFKQIEPIIEDIERPRDAKELAERAKQGDVGSIQKAIEAFRKSAEFILPEIQKIIKNFASDAYKQRQVADKGWMSSLVDATQVLHGGKGLVADDFDDVRHALETYLLDIQNVNKVLADVGSFQNQVKSELEQASNKSSEMFGSKPSDTTTAPSQTTQDLDNKADALNKGIDAFKGLMGS